MKKTKKTSLIFSSLLAFILAIAILVLPWNNFFPKDKIIIEGSAYAPLLDKTFPINKNYLVKNYTIDGKIFLEGEIELGRDTFFFGDLKSYLKKQNNIKSLQELDELKDMYSPAELMKNNKIKGFAWSKTYGLIALSHPKNLEFIDSFKQNDKNYGVYLDNDKLKGYGWSDLMGWICWGGCVNQTKNQAQTFIQEEVHIISKSIAILFSIKHIFALIVFGVGIIISLFQYKLIPTLVIFPQKDHIERRRKPPRKTL